MKIAILSLVLALAALTATEINAQTVVTTAPTATVYQGVVSNVDPTSRTIIVQAPGATSAPITYTYTPETVFVDSTGNTVPMETIRNSSVRVEYETNGGRTIVRRVITTTTPAAAVGGVVTAPAVPAPPSAPVIIHKHNDD